jgi:hypothetical protein
MLQQSRSIAQYTAITLTYKIQSQFKPAGGGDHGVNVFVCVMLVVCNCIYMYGRSLKLGTHMPSLSYVTTLYGTEDRFSYDSTEK